MVREDSTGLVETLRPLWLYTRAEDLLHRGWTGCLQSFQHKPEEKKREGKVTETVPFKLLWRSHLTSFAWLMKRM